MVLPASCRQGNLIKALPARRRQHLVGSAVRLVGGSRSDCMRKNERRLSTSRPNSDPSQEWSGRSSASRSEEHTSELQSQSNLVCRLLLEKKNSPSQKASPARLTGTHAS